MSRRIYIECNPLKSLNISGYVTFIVSCLTLKM